jgi:hypothetical protein
MLPLPEDDPLGETYQFLPLVANDAAAERVAALADSDGIERKGGAQISGARRLIDDEFAPILAASLRLVAALVVSPKAVVRSELPRRTIAGTSDHSRHGPSIQISIDLSAPQD